VTGNGALLIPPFNSHIFSYRTFVAASVSAVRITAYVLPNVKVMLILIVAVFAPLVFLGCKHDPSSVEEKIFRLHGILVFSQ
jgi:hypothetical protein